MKEKLRRLINVSIGWTEVVIGISTLLGCFVFQSFEISNIPPKPYNLYVFVIVTATAAFVFGMGLLFHREWARVLLVYFSGYIIITKILVYSGLLSFSTAILRVIPEFSRDIISVTYHLSVILLLTVPYRGRKGNV